MGYQITWKSKNIKEKLEARFKTTSKRSSIESSLKDIRRKILLECCRLSNKSDLNFWSIELELNHYIYLLQEQWRVTLQERLEEDEEYWLCGWEYARDSYSSPEYKEVLIQEIFNYSFCSKPTDPIDDSEYFETKFQKIKDTLDAFEEYVCDELYHDFADTYRDDQLKDEEDGEENVLPAIPLEDETDN